MTLQGEKCEKCEGIKPALFFGGIPVFTDPDVPIDWSPMGMTGKVLGGCYCEDESDA